MMDTMIYYIFVFSLLLCGFFPVFGLLFQVFSMFLVKI